MAHWIRFEHQGRTGFGTVENDSIKVHSGDMFGAAKPSGETLALAAVKVLTPTQPGKMVALWNNFQALAAKLATRFRRSRCIFSKATTRFSRMAAPSASRPPIPARWCTRASWAS